MENKNPIQEEINELSPDLAGLLPPKHNIAGPDPAYFETLPDKILDRVKKEAVANPTPVIRLMKRIAVAAALIGVLFLAGKLYFNEPEDVNITQELAKISNAELEAYLTPIDDLGTNAAIQKELKQLDLNDIKTLSIYYQLEN